MCDLESSVPDWLMQHPETAAIFEEHYIDTACAGKSLRYLCEENNLNPVKVLEQLNAFLSKESETDPPG